jgi:outer membrane protein OmpA-like peptidoglycan-associated protein
MPKKSILLIFGVSWFSLFLAAQNTSDLGRTEPFLVGFKGTIYNLPSSPGLGVDPQKMRYTPEIEMSTPIGYVYTQSLFITERYLTVNFPGVPKGKTTFAIVYTARFEVKSAGVFEFLLQSDDGSRLWIDSVEVIDRDGLRQFKEVKRGKIMLSSGFHDIKVWYFQGFPNKMGLILMCKRTEEKGFKPFDFKPLEEEAKQFFQRDSQSTNFRFAENFTFETGEYEIKPEANGKLDTIMRYINYNPHVTCRIEGHTDDVGSAKDNLILSQNRANAIVAALKSRGIPATVELEVKGYGRSRPIVSNATAEGRAQNRRVDVIIEPILEKTVTLPDKF